MFCYTVRAMKEMNWWHRKIELQDSVIKRSWWRQQLSVADIISKSPDSGWETGPRGGKRRRTSGGKWEYYQEETGASNKTPKSDTSDDKTYPSTPEEASRRVGEALNESLGVDTPEFKQGVMDKVKNMIRKIGSEAKYQGKTELRNNLNMFRYIASVFSGGKIKMSPEERKTSLAYMAFWTWGMVPAKLGGISAAVKLAAVTVLPASIAWPVGAAVAFVIGSKLLYPALSKVMKKAMEKAGEKLDPEVEQYVEGYKNSIDEEKQKRISFVKALGEDGFDPEKMDEMIPLFSTLI